MWSLQLLSDDNSNWKNHSTPQPCSCQVLYYCRHRAATRMQMRFIMCVGLWKLSWINHGFSPLRKLKTSFSPHHCCYRYTVLTWFYLLNKGMWMGEGMDGEDRYSQNVNLPRIARTNNKKKYRDDSYIIG